MSKREILESLYAEQNQSNATLSRLFTAVARSLDIEPSKLAEMFGDDKGNQEYVDEFNKAVKELHAKQHQHEQSTDSDHSPEVK